MRMARRERFEALMKRRPVDRVVYDFAGTSLNTMESEAQVRRMAERLGFSGPYTGEYDKFDERILQALDIDVRRVGNILEPESPLAWRSEVETVNCWGVKNRFTGLYWDIVESPLKNATLADLDSYPWPDPRRIDGAILEDYRKRARQLNEHSDYVVCGEHPVFGVMELGCWMCGFDTFLLKMALEPEFVKRFFDIVLEYQKEVIRMYYGAIGEFIHFTTSGDDFGTQTGPFVSPAMFAQAVAPYYRERIAYTHQYTDAYYLHHTCGSVFALVPSLIGAGVDILNPIQPGARDMDPRALRDAYGNGIVFHGGIDTQHLLPHGSEEDVHKAVYAMLDIFRDGGYILSPAHNIQTDVPPENVIAIYKAARDYYAER